MRLSTELVTDFDGFGTYSCLPTVLLFLLQAQEADVAPFYQYNWDIDYIREADYLSGSVEDQYLYEFLESCYGATVTKLCYEELQPGELYILCMSLYDVSYSEYYRKDDFPHVLVIRHTGDGMVEAWDPVFKRITVITEEECRAYWEREKHALVHIRMNSTEAAGHAVKPFLAGRLYKEKYEASFGMVEQVLEVCRGQSADTEFLFSRYFGMIHSIYAARDKYFRAAGMAGDEQRALILSGWRSVEKALMRAKLTMQDRGVHQAFRKVFDLELDYIGKLAAGG